MKSYTDLGQSRKLGKILRHDSADMCWCNNSIRGVNYTDEFSANLYTVKELKDIFDTAFNGWDKYWKLIPCWSLAALVGIIPEVSLNAFKDGSWNAAAQHDGKTIYVDKDNPVDACVELIITLHELKML